MSEEKLSPTRINLIAWDITDGVNDPEDAKRLMRTFVAHVRDEDPIPPVLKHHFADAFDRFLSEDQTLERALGLHTKSGRRVRMLEKHQKAALLVLRHRLTGRTLNNAAILVSEKVHLTKNRVENAWAKHKYPALEKESMNRALKNPDRRAHWTQQEEARLRKMYRGYIVDAPQN